MSGTSASRPFFPRILRRPHSFIANTASSTLRFVARARSAKVHFTTTWVVALPSRFWLVVNVLGDLNKGSAHQVWDFRMENKWGARSKKYRPSITESGAVGKSKSISISPSHPFTLFLRFRFGPAGVVENSIGEAGSSPAPTLILATSRALPSVWAIFGGKTERRRLGDSTSVFWGTLSSCKRSSPQKADYGRNPVGQIATEPQVRKGSLRSSDFPGASAKLIAWKSQSPLSQENTPNLGDLKRTKFNHQHPITLPLVGGQDHDAR